MALVLLGCFDFVAFKSTLGRVLIVGGVMIEIVAVFSFVSQKIRVSK